LITAAYHFPSVQRAETFSPTAKVTVAAAAGAAFLAAGKEPEVPEIDNVLTPSSADFSSFDSVLSLKS